MASNLDSDFVIPPMRVGEPAWAIAQFYPLQGSWSEEDYFNLEFEHFVELTQDGCLEVLPMPNPLHQAIAYWIAAQLNAWPSIGAIGNVFLAPVPLKLPSGEIREPDVIISPKHSATARHLTTAVFVVEIVSGGAEARNRDYVVKRSSYAKAGISEYWIIDPKEKSITVLKLSGAEYVVHGRFSKDGVATSATLEGFAIHCGEMWELEKNL